MRMNEQIGNAKQIVCVSPNAVRYIKQHTARQARHEAKRDPENAIRSRRFKYRGYLA